MRRDCSCDDFTRSELLRGIASAGNGLPGVEPGMPTPAGTGMNRRSFLVRAAGTVATVYGASALSPERMEYGIAQAAAATPNQPVLVSIFMAGGWDAMSVLAPVGDPKYATLRPTLGLAAGAGPAFTEDSRLMWHPAAAGLATLHGEGKVTTFPGVGYTPQDESHFTSRHYWEVGELDTSVVTGWMGRYLDVAGSPDNPMQGLSLDDTLSPALATANVPVAAIASPASFTLGASGLGSPIEIPAVETFGALGAIPGTSPALTQARNAAKDTSEVLSQVAPYVTSNGQPNYNPPVTYPTAGGAFPQQLAALAAMVAGGAPISCASLTAVGSFDTHSDEAATLTTNLQQTVNAVLAFQRDLEARGIADRVLIHLWSEFGRRPQENGSGTDHGAGGAGFLIGTKASGTMVGEFPGLETLDANENLLSTVDFRAVYCSLIEQWFATDSGLVIPGASGFSRPTLLKP